MPEGFAHVTLVDEILSFLFADGEPEYIVLTDRAGEKRDCRCPNVGGFVPDIYAVSVRDTQRRTIGEAKSAVDFTSTHTEPQLRAFIRHMAVYERPTLLIAVPFSVIPAATLLVRRLLNSMEHVKAVAIAPQARHTIAEGWAA